MLINILIAVGLVSLISFTGVFYLKLNHALLNRMLPVFVAFAAGAMLAVSLFDLLPESLEMLPEVGPTFVMMGILGFALFEQIIHWHHQHHRVDDCDDCTHPHVGYSVLLGDGLHNFLDGVLIASAFMVDPVIGWTTTLAVISHEIPQELGDYAVLIHSGFKPRLALTYNLVSALAAVAGGVLGYFFLQGLERIVPYILAVGAGGFLYIALADLLSELKMEKTQSKRWLNFGALVLGVITLYVILHTFHE